ncbi:uncharacterized protein LOC128132334 [Lactuca sativa]|uniref:uncharacterized protein LOC128132334 n=1 Tax=Lactuca sativa TaxID=4236 RepID=UPI0022AFA2D7|nr:uncharacterized protein LOC128132334 [Lactuca sativa]
MVFNGKTEERTARKPLRGETVFSRVENLNVTFGKFKALLLNIKGKSKDEINVREDMVEMGILPELAPIRNPRKRTYLPVACYTMSKDEKTKFCKCLHGVKVSSGYSANIKKLVSMKELKLFGMKSHDCHVLMAHMIPIAIRGILPDRIRHTITKLCLFFNMIHSKVIDPEVLDSWESNIILTLCQLEMYFPPSFFDVMVYLTSHIVREIKYCGPVFLRYMYPFERYMGILKGYVRNRHRQEGSIVEGYATEEVIEYCTDYLQGVYSIGIPKSQHKGRLVGSGTIRLKKIIPNQEDLQLAHFTILQHMTIIAPYINEHKRTLEFSNRGRSNRWLVNEHNKTFSQWLKDKVRDSVDQVVVHLRNGPDDLVATYQGYNINGYTIYTNQQDEIWELKYDSIIIPMLKCKCVDNQRGVKVDNDGFTVVDLTTNGYVSEPFILAKQATQVFYVEDPRESGKHIVMHSKRHILGVDDVVDEEEYDQFDELPPFIIGIASSNDDVDDTTYLRAFETYEKNTSIPIVWKLTECNQVGVLECELSGHYVMNWIFDFVLNRQHGFQSRFGTLWNDKTAFEEKALVTTVATLAREFLKNFMNDVVVV